MLPCTREGLPCSQKTAEWTVASTHFSIDAVGAWSFTANSAFNSLNTGNSVSETYNVTSVDGTASTVQITINGSNDAPVAYNDEGDVQEDLRLVGSGNVITGTASGAGKDIDPDAGAMLTISADSGSPEGDYGTLLLLANGSYWYTLNNSLAVVNKLHNREFLYENFAYTVTDQYGLTSSANLRITIEGHNDIPFGEPDVATTFTSDPVNIPVLLNDGDLEGDALTVRIINVPQLAGGGYNVGGGTAYVLPNGTINFIAADNYFNTNPASGSST